MFDDPIIVKEPEVKQFAKITEGPHAAICCGVYPLGVHMKKRDGKDKPVNQVLICFQVDELIEEEGDSKGDAKTFSEFYTSSLNESANLRKDLESWRGKKFTDEELKGFDLRDILGAPCLLNIIHNDKYVNKNSIMKLPKAMAPPVVFGIHQSTPEWITKIQEKSLGEIITDDDNDNAGVSDDAEEKGIKED